MSKLETFNILTKPEFKYLPNSLMEFRIAYSIISYATIQIRNCHFSKD